ncbi:Uncharacterised protein [Klebsiella aerogenes]|nr:Uncharacterised protein [Klebsiella aerogenes]
MQSKCISKRQGFRVGLNILNVTHDADITQLFAAHLSMES